jgi:hypothetical protein
MNTKKIGMFAILAIAIATAISGTMVASLATPAFAGGDEKKCKNNEDNNCNDKHRTQKIKAENECEIENYNKDHSSRNDNENFLRCENLADNINDSEFVEVFEETDNNSHVDETESQQVE